VLDETISKVDGKQLVKAADLPKPSPLLASLAIDSGVLSPAFSPGTREYTVSLPYAKESLGITAAPAYSPATLFLGAARITAGQPAAASLQVGQNRFVITVSAADTSSQYAITAARAAYVPPQDTSHTDTSHTDTSHVDHGKPKPGPNEILVLNWKHYGAILLNWDNQGLGENVVLTHFPLLLRLDGSNFDFSEAAADGRDLRIATSSGNLLPFELAAWDPTAKVAELWIMLDTLRIRDEKETLLLYWGNSAAAAVSDPAKVFAPDGGWSGVWHLNEAGRGSAGEYEDATGRFNATGGAGDGKNVPARRAGVVGYGQDFKAKNVPTFLSMPSAFDPGDKAWTFTAWIRRIGNEKSVIFHKMSGNQAYEQRFEIATLAGVGEEVTVTRDGAYFITGVYLPDEAFVQLGVVWDGTQLHCYLDGFEQNAMDWTQGGKSGAEVFLGAASRYGAYGFHGMMDEVWFSSEARDPRWMQLLYENQMPYSGFVGFLKLQ
jgi:hypothetical protein